MKKKGLVNKIFLENRNIIEEDMKKNNLSKKQAIVKITSILYDLATDLYFEKGRKPFQLKEIYEELHFKLGYYEILDKRDFDPQAYIQQCTLTPTKKGREIYTEFIRLNSKK